MCAQRAPNAPERHTGATSSKRLRPQLRALLAPCCAVACAAVTAGAHRRPSDGHECRAWRACVPALWRRCASPRPARLARRAPRRLSAASRALRAARCAARPARLRATDPKHRHAVWARRRAPATPLPRRHGAARRGAWREAGCRAAGSSCAAAESARPFSCCSATRSLLSDASLPRHARRAAAGALRGPAPRHRVAWVRLPPLGGAGRRQAVDADRGAAPRARAAPAASPLPPHAVSSRAVVPRLAAGPLCARFAPRRGPRCGCGAAWRRAHAVALPRSLAPARPARAPERPRSCVQAVLSPPRPGGDAPYTGGAVDNEVLLREKDACGVGFIASVKARARLLSRPMRCIELPGRAAARRGRAASAAALCARCAAGATSRVWLTGAHGSPLARRRSAATARCRRR